MEAVLSLLDPYKKTCKYSGCKKSFEARRLNMDFCSSTCKKKENNIKASKFRTLVKKITAQHYLNWKLLDTLHRDGKFEVSNEFLTLNHFNHSKPTGVSLNTANDLVPEFYNYALIQIKENVFKINKLW